jgi:hypothetical protein
MSYFLILLLITGLTKVISIPRGLKADGFKCPISFASMVVPGCRLFQQCYSPYTFKSVSANSLTCDPVIPTDCGTNTIGIHNDAFLCSGPGIAFTETVDQPTSGGFTGVEFFCNETCPETPDIVANGTILTVCMNIVTPVCRGIIIPRCGSNLRAPLSLIAAAPKELNTLEPTAGLRVSIDTQSAKATGMTGNAHSPNVDMMLAIVGALTACLILICACCICAGRGRKQIEKSKRIKGLVDFSEVYGVTPRKEDAVIWSTEDETTGNTIVIPDNCEADGDGGSPSMRTRRSPSKRRNKDLFIL